MRRAELLFLTFLCSAAYGATTIDVSSHVAVPTVKRFGINLGWMNNYDSGQIMKNLIVCTAHSQFKDASLYANTKLVVDTRNIVIARRGLTVVRA